VLITVIEKGFVMAISSLGIGSGVLTADVIDQLRAADESVILKPLETKIELATQKDEAYTLLSSLMNTFKSSTSTLGGESLYQNRTVTGNTDAVTITAQSGADVQSFNITNVSKAEKDVWNSQNAFSNTTVPITGLGSGTLDITIGGKIVSLEYTSATTIDDIKFAINENAGDLMTASSLQIGDSSYSLAISSDTLNQAITFSDSNGDADGLSALLNLANIQPAKGASFKYNGVAITRSTNDISDLINGVTIKLNQNQAVDDTATIAIGQNDTQISSEIAMFVENLNLLTSNLKDMTSSDVETGATGIFNTESSIKSITGDLTQLLTQTNSSGASLVDYGIEIDRYGVVSLNSSVFSAKYSEDPVALELLFRGDGETDGVFKQLDTKMEDYTKYNGYLVNFSDKLTTLQDSLVAQYDKQKASLDARYETMAKRFSAYDAMITRLNSQFSSLQMMIDAQANSDN